ncbi:MAG: hypothetical protein M3N18_03610 [Actinomycetota bacterium]|nr:hypothetical protein [Actinomycetota bacterium]
MNFDFPAPYDERIPRVVGRLRAELSPEGVDLLARMIEKEEDPEVLGEELGRLGDHDGALLLRFNELLAEAYDARIREDQGGLDLHRQTMTLFDRAAALEPKFAARVRADEATVGEAVTILRRHGAPVGVSDEVLDMLVEVPPEE